MWESYWTYFLKARLEQLEKNIRKLQRENGDLKNSSDVRLFVGAVKGMSEARKTPTSKEYLLGNTIGSENRDWRRIKKLLPSRYRLFFKFFSQHREVFFVWLNDENTLRHDGAKSDCYAYFKRLLEKNTVPSDRDSLKEISSPSTEA